MAGNSKIRSRKLKLWLIVLAAIATNPAFSDSLSAQTTGGPFANGPRRASQSASSPTVKQPASTSTQRKPQSPFSDARPITPSGNYTNSTADGKRKMSAGGPSAWKTFGALAGIIALIVFGGRLWKKHGPNLSGNLPAEAIDVLGKRTVDARQAIYLVRLGSRIIVLGSTANGLRTLSEVTDPVEVDYLAGLCRQRDDDNTVAQSFRSLFSGQNILNATSESAAKEPARPVTDLKTDGSPFAPPTFAEPGRTNV